MPWIQAGATVVGAGIGAFGGGGNDPEAVSALEALPQDWHGPFDWARDFATEDIWKGGPYAEGGRRVAPPQYYPGQTYADLTGMQNQGLMTQADAVNNMHTAFINPTNASFRRALNAGDFYNDPNVQLGMNAIANRGNWNLAENILPQIRHQATGTGNQYSSKAEQNEAQAAMIAQRAISDAQGTFAGNQLNSARALQGQTIGNAPNITQLSLLPGETQYGIGSIQQAQNQLGINENVDRYNFNRDAPGKQIDRYIGRLTSLTGVGGSPFQMSQPGPSTNTWANAMGGAKMGYDLGGLISPYFSNPSQQNQSFMGTMDQWGQGTWGDPFLSPRKL